MSLTIANALNRLISSYQSDHLAHAYALIGDPGEVKHQLVHPFLKKLLQAEPFPHPDVHIVQPESKTRQIRVETLRNLISLLNQTSFLGGWKIAILYEAERLRQEAANAFLKTLEEPPHKTLILLLTARPEQLLTTILSRCLILRLQTPSTKIPPASLKGLLENLKKLAQSPAKAYAESYVYLNSCLDYLKETRKTLENEAEKEIKLAKEKGLEGEALNEIEKTNAAQVETDYMAQRQQLLVWLTEILPRKKSIINLFDQSQKALARNLPEAFILERLFLRLVSEDISDKN
jgi:DNA polymerase-3 subunit delta'